MALVVLGSGALLGCGNAEERAAREQSEARAGMSEAAATAQRAGATPSTGLWTEEQLLDRLVRAGVAPRRVESPTSAPGWMPEGSLVFLAGGGEVRAWILKDSTARRAVTDRLDPLTGTPAGETVPYPPPMTFVMQNNLVAVVTGGTERNQERVALALQAGLPVTSPAGKVP